MEQSVSYKGQWCIYNPAVFCQEGWCGGCEVYRTWESALYEGKKPEKDVTCSRECPADLIALRHALFREMDDELSANNKYREASAKFVHFKIQGYLPDKFNDFSLKLSEIASDEFNHYLTLKAIIEVIDEECGCGRNE